LKEYLTEIVKNPVTGMGAKEVAENLLSQGTLPFMQKEY
jgi:hypothetical protein